MNVLIITILALTLVVLVGLMLKSDNYKGRKPAQYRIPNAFLSCFSYTLYNMIALIRVYVAGIAFISQAKFS